VHPKSATSMVASELGSEKDLVGAGMAISVLFGINGIRNKQSHYVGPPFPAFKACFTFVCLSLLKLPLGAVLSLTTEQNRNWSTFGSSRDF